MCRKLVICCHICGKLPASDEYVDPAARDWSYMFPNPRPQSGSKRGARAAFITTFVPTKGKSNGLRRGTVVDGWRDQLRGELKYSSRRKCIVFSGIKSSRRMLPLPIGVLIRTLFSLLLGIQFSAMAVSCSTPLYRMQRRF